LENYDPNWTPNTTDAAHSRYRFGHQPQIAQWNLFQLAQAVYPLIEQTEPLQQALSDFSDIYQQAWNSMMANKLGLPCYEVETDAALIEELLAILSVVETDMTIFYRNLAEIDLDSDALNEMSIEPLKEAYYQSEAVDNKYITRLLTWLQNYGRRVRSSGVDHEQRHSRMNAVNPKYVLRNYLAQLAIDKSEQGDHSMVKELLEVLSKPYEEQKGMERYAEKRPEWARNRAGCSMLSCSS